MLLRIIMNANCQILCVETSLDSIHNDLFQRLAPIVQLLMVIQFGSVV